MVEIDLETLERVRRWCAEAGRQVGPDEVRAALAPLDWDELLDVRARLADPPPARPLGPLALVDLARGVPADLAAEREREGRYRPEPSGEAPGPMPVPESPGPPSPSAPRSAARPRGRAARRPTAPLVRRKADQPPPELRPAAQVEGHALEELFAPGGRAVLERLVRAHGARRPFLLAGVAAWRGPAGAPTEADLDALLDHHGLAHAFAHRERDELLHALRAARGSRASAAARVGLAPEGFQAALARLGAAEAAERIREERRSELRRRGTLSERCRLLLDEGELVEDLGLADELLADLRARLPEHLRALRAGPDGPTATALARSLSLSVKGAAAVALRVGLELPEDRSRQVPAPRRPRSAPAPGRPRPRSPAPRRRGAPGPRRPARAARRR